jgi:hypothetical protein
LRCGGFARRDTLPPFFCTGWRAGNLSMRFAKPAMAKTKVRAEIRASIRHPEK